MKLLEKKAYERKINSLKLEKERLEEIIKDELFIQFMDYQNLKEENDVLKQENEKYREKIKELKKKVNGIDE